MLGALTLSIACADSLTIVNPNFSAVSVQCSNGYAYQSFMGGNCAGPLFTQQDFNSGLGIGWTFTYLPAGAGGTGVTGPNTAFYPPPFTGLPFSRAAFLQGSNATLSQTIAGFVPRGLYTLSFYLGSRYSSSFDGNQTVQVTIDSQVIGSWNLVSFTPFTLQTVAFSVAHGGSHTLKFAGAVSGDHTAFFSGLSIATASSLTVSPASGFPGIRVAVSAGGFAPSETVSVFGYGATPAAIGTATADASGNAIVEGRIPQTPFGKCGLKAIGHTSGTVASGTVSVTPRLLVNPKTGKVGDSISAGGLGFAAGEAVNVIWLSPATSLGSSTTDGNGSFPTLIFAIPSGVPPGSNAVIATGQRSGVIASAQITIQ